MAKRGNKAAPKNGTAEIASYRHPEAESLLRPDVGTQAQFRKKKEPRQYRYDSSLSPVLEWDGQNSARERGERELAEISGQCSVVSVRWSVISDQLKDIAGKLEKTGRKQEADELRRLLADHWPLTTDHLLKAADALRALKALSRPFLNWAGKAERLSFAVPTLPLFVHERLSTKAILETLKGHRKDKQLTMFDLFADPQHPVIDQVLRAYEHKDNWINRLVLGDSLVVMNSLLHYESLGGQVQMIYMDPPYGVKFGSNFQPFVRKRDVSHNDDEDMTREPEMVQAYRDTWELGLHSYLTYLRDRLLLCRDLLAPTGSIFVQISDENVHHIREIMDEVFGAENFVAVITFSKTTGFSSNVISSVADYIVWYARDLRRVKYRQMFRQKEAGDEGATKYKPVDSYSSVEKGVFQPARLATLADLTSQGALAEGSQPFEYKGRTWNPPTGLHWKTTVEGLKTLAVQKRLVIEGNSLRYLRFLDDFPVYPLANVWTDIGGIQNRSEGKLYVVQTATLAIERCLLMTTDPGDLVFDPTCGSGTTAYVAEQWGRRWITCDTSRVPLALARQRLLTATFPFHELIDEGRGPAGGFVYRRKQNQKGEEVGGIVPHITLKSIANNEPAQEEVLVDRPEAVNGVTRVTGPFAVEATIPTPVDWEGDGQEDSGAESAQDRGTFVDRMIEVLRHSPVLQIGGGRSVTLKNIRPPAKTLCLSAEALVEVSGVSVQVSGKAKAADSEATQVPDTRNLKPETCAVAIVFGPENGAVSEKLVYEAAREAHAKNYTHLYVIGFGIQPNARKLVEDCDAVVGVSATYIQATPDILMGDLLKNMRSSQIFSVCGLPDVRLRKVKVNVLGDKAKGKNAMAAEPSATYATEQYEVELVGLDVFDPTTMEVEHRKGDDVPAWFLDTDYNGLCFHVCQAFFPRTSAWENLKRALKGEYEDSVWEHLAGAVSTPFAAGEHGQIAVKVIDDRGNELLVVKSLKEAAG